MTEASPPMPRRVFVAAALAAVTAAGAVALGVTGALSTPETESFKFSRGVSFAQGEESRLRGHLAKAFEDDRLMVVIVGHSGNQGDESANLALSTDRAQAAAAIAYDVGITPDNVQATGVGGGDPLPKPEGVSDRAHQSSLARVEVTLQVRR